MKITKYLSVSMLTTALIFSSCKKEEVEPTPEPTPTPTYASSTYNYKFNNGQVAEGTHYDGMHKDDITATMSVTELASGSATISVTLNNTVDGETYMIHAHDAADPSTTPNGTPYNESPNADVFTKMAMGNGGSVTVSQTTTMSYAAITSTYSGFFVVHDPLQTINTADISTYLFVGSFARMQAEDNLNRSVFPYDFNTGQVSPTYAYSGAHPTNLMGEVTVQDIAGGTSRVTVELMNTVNGETYMVHAHDAADPATTPNGTPYDESPNSDVMTSMISGNGGASFSSQFSSKSHLNITSIYNGFFVVHDPLQAVDTTDPTTYVLLGLFAR